MARIVDWAIRYGKLGFRIVPLLPKEKRPPCKSWQHMASADPETIARWWNSSETFVNADGSRWRGNADYNVGLVTGRLAPGEITERLQAVGKLRPGESCYIAVVDEDQHPEDGRYGRDIADAWETEEGRFPETWTAETGSGGRHLFFLTKKPMPRQQHLYSRSIDFQSDGALIVLPPSIHPNGRRYFWDVNPGDCSPGFINDTVIKFLAQGFEDRPNSAPGGASEEIPEGSRTTTLFRILSRLRAQGLGREAIRAAIISENKSRCKPPLSSEELEKTVLCALDKDQAENFRSSFRLEERLTGAARINSLCRAIYYLLGKGFDSEAVKSAIRIENTTKCVPPLSSEELEARVFPALIRFYGGGY